MKAISLDNSKLNIDEPFKGLFTQGMVCHETYKDKNNNWISPEEVISMDNKKFLKSDNTHEIKVGPSESMSKSKKNTIDPESIIENYGSDAVRLFILSDSPPEKDVQWSDEGIISSYKFVQKLWSLNLKIIEEIKKNYKINENKELEIYTNEFIKNITANLDNFNYNKIIANIHELYGFLIKNITKKYNTKTWLENYSKILIAINPIVPHLSSECLGLINRTDINKWPSYNEKILEKNSITIVVQINGKKRSLIETKKNIEESELLELIKKDANTRKYVLNKNILKKIYVPNKIINIIL